MLNYYMLKFEYTFDFVPLSNKVRGNIAQIKQTKIDLNRHWGKELGKNFRNSYTWKMFSSCPNLLAPMATKQREGTIRYLIRLHRREQVLEENHETRAPAHSHTPANRSNT